MLLQDAKKGVLFIDFPPVLQLQLKRFEYDFMRDTMVKVSTWETSLLHHGLCQWQSLRFSIRRGNNLMTWISQQHNLTVAST